jgi:hypothetical protein
MARRPSQRRRFHGGRAMLNLPGHHSTGALVAEIEDTSRWKKGKNGEGEELQRWNARPWITLQVADCTRSVSFDFDIADPDSRANDLHKVNTMLDLLTKFRDGLVAEQERYVERLAVLPVDADDE